jgi:long-chain fatty acid transport protein
MSRVEVAVSVMILAIGVGSTKAAHAGAFAIEEQSAADLGRAFAGTTTTADDPTILYFNPAGITRFRRLMTSTGLSMIGVYTAFQNTASQPALGQPLGNNGGNAGSWNAVPNFYLVAPLSRRFSVGVAINAPFGLKTDYPSGWLGQYQALLSQLKTENFNISVAWKASDHWSFGLGPDYEHIQATLTNAANYAAVVAGGVEQLVLAGQIPPAAAPSLLAANAGLTGNSGVSGSGGGWGFQLGALYSSGGSWKVGLAYRSEVKAKITGTVGFTAPTATSPVGEEIIASASETTLSNGPVYMNLTLPATVLGSATVRITPRAQLMADVQFTQWSVFRTLAITRSTGLELSAVPENYHDTWRIAFGGDYRLNSEWLLRAGTAYDETPVPTATRNPRLPDNGHLWLASGVQWRPSGRFTVDLGYAHLFEHPAAINTDGGNPELYGTLVGEQHSHADIVSLQLTTAF